MAKYLALALVALVLSSDPTWAAMAGYSHHTQDTAPADQSAAPSGTTNSNSQPAPKPHHKKKQN
jgi:hypothetical protein